MARLPIPGGDQGNWGDILNEFLQTAHNADGSIADNAVTPAALGDNAVSSTSIQNGAVTPAKLSGDTPANGEILSYNGSDFEWIAATGAGTSDHGVLTGLSDDDHPQYLNVSRGDARYYTQAQMDTSLSGKSDTAHTHATTLAANTDVQLTSVAAGEILTYDDTDNKWKNTSPPGTPTYANLPSGTTVTVLKSGGTWPARPTARTDIVVIWKGADPSPSIVSSGTGGMLDEVDMRFVTS